MFLFPPFLALNKTGFGSIELLSKLLFALGVIDSLNDTVQERIRIATLPSDLSALTEKPFSLPKRIRVKKGKMKITILQVRLHFSCDE